ncbi:MAG: CHRD domain-containing protein [Gammaproteobacteria bacterium]
MNHFLLIIFMSLASSSVVFANTVFSFNLSGDNEVPAVVTPGSGNGSVIFDLNAQTMRVIVSFSDLLGTSTAAHIHCCAPAGTNVAVATMLPSFAGFPLDVTNGNYDATFDLSDDSTYSPSFLIASGDSVTVARDSLLEGMQNGQAYFNLHTSLFPGGEVRGNILPATVPLPSGVWLFVGGLAFLMFRNKGMSLGA